MELPNYYIVNRKLEPEQAPHILHALQITPCVCAIISDILDANFALTLTSELIRTHSEDAAFDIARRVWAETQRPALVIGTADVLDAVYADGRREGVAISC